MAENSKEPKLLPGIYPTRVDTGAEIPVVPEPESPPALPESLEVPRREWQPKFSKYLRSQGRGKKPKKTE